MRRGRKTPGSRWVDMTDRLSQLAICIVIKTKYRAQWQLETFAIKLKSKWCSKSGVQKIVNVTRYSNFLQ